MYCFAVLEAAGLRLGAGEVLLLLKIVGEILPHPSYCYWCLVFAMAVSRF